MELTENLYHRINELEAENAGLRAAVQTHHDQRGDSRCHLDDLKLYHDVLGEGVDPYVGALPPDEDMAESCRRYIEQRRCPGPQGVAPLPGGMTIQQLTAEAERLTACVTAFGVDPATLTPDEATQVYAQWQADWGQAARDSVDVERLRREYDRDISAANETLAETLAERDKLSERSTFLEQGLRDIEERLRTGTGPIREALKDLKDPAVVRAWKWAVYGSCIHAQLVLGPATAGEGGNL